MDYNSNKTIKNGEFKEKEQKSNNYEFDNSGFKSKEYREEDEFNIWDLDQLFKDRVRALHDINREFFNDPRFADHPLNPMNFKKDDEKERLQPLSIRVKPHTKRFLKEESPLSAREILEIYEEYNNGSEDYINSLLQDEIQLKKELAEIEEKLKNAREFTDKLNHIKAKKAKENEKNKKIKINID